MLTLKRLAAGAALVLAVAMAPCADATSLGVQPLFVEMTPTQSKTIRVSNSAENDTPVEVLIYRRDIDADGNQVRIPADDDFIVFPPQATIGSGKQQAFRIRPVSPDTDLSSSYYVSFTQIPELLEDTGEGVQLQVIFAFDAAVHIVPSRAKSDAQIKSVALATMSVERDTGETTQGASGAQAPVVETVTIPAVAVEMENAGNKYLYLHHQVYKATLTDEAGETRTVSWTSEEVRNSQDILLVEPSERRRFKLPLPDGTVAKSVSLDVRPRDR